MKESIVYWFTVFCTLFFVFDKKLQNICIYVLSFSIFRSCENSKQEPHILDENPKSS